MILACWLLAPIEPVIVAEVVAATAFVVTLKFAEVALAGIETDAGIVVAETDEVVSLTTVAARIGAEIVTVPAAAAPPKTEDGDMLIPDT